MRGLLGVRMCERVGSWISNRAFPLFLILPLYAIAGPGSCRQYVKALRQ